jgi:hypothetical protein
VRSLVALASAVALVAALGGAARAADPLDEPMRPQAKSLPAPVVAPEERVPVAQPLAQSPEDCEAIAPNQGPPPKKYKERDIEGGAAKADDGVKTLIRSESKTLPYEEVAAKIEEAVGKLFGALAADPYNVHATYNLAAAYARIGRNQCSLNLLARLVAMKSWPSAKKEIATKKSRLFGSEGRWKGKPDPDFDKLREDARFKEVTQSF